MSYAALYEYCQQLSVPVSRRHIIPKVCELAKRKNKPKVMLSGLDPAIVAGFILWPGVSTHPFARYGDGEPVIVVARAHNNCWQRFVVVKELMHYFDKPLEHVSSAEDFCALVTEFSSPALEHRSASMGSEVKGLWMALGLFCPEPLRQDLQRKRAAGEIDDSDIATMLKIPLAYVSALFHKDFKEYMTDLCDC